MNIDIEDFYLDGRFDNLAALAGEDRLTAEARVLRVWAKCYLDRNESLDGEDINNQARWARDDVSFADLMVKAKIAHRLDDGRYFVRGTKKRIKYLRDASAAGTRGANIRWAKERATGIASTAIGIVKRQHDTKPETAEKATAEAHAEIVRAYGEDGWSLLMRRHSTWSRFVSDFASDYRKSYGSVFETKLVESLAAFILADIEKNNGGTASG